MKNPFSVFFRSRDKPKDAVSTAPTFYFGSSASGKSVNPRSAMQVSVVYACVRVIAETIASLPLGVYAGRNRPAAECHEVWVFGNNISIGMDGEIGKAKSKKMLIRYFTTDCEELGKQGNNGSE